MNKKNRINRMSDMIKELYDNDNDTHGNFYMNNDNIIINLDDDVCICNLKNTDLDKLILFYCYLYTDCKTYPYDLENNDYYDYEYNYGYIDNFHISKDINYKKIQKMIKEKTKLIFTKNYLGLAELQL